MKQLVLKLSGLLVVVLSSLSAFGQCGAPPASMVTTTTGTLDQAITANFTPSGIPLSGNELLVPVSTAGTVVGDPVCVQEAGGTFFFSNIAVRRSFDCYREAFPGFRFIDAQANCPQIAEQNFALRTVDQTGQGNYEGYTFIIYDPDNNGQFFTVTGPGIPFNANDSAIDQFGQSTELPPSAPGTAPSTVVTVPNTPSSTFEGAQMQTNQVLPVELVSFTAEVESKNVVLRWETALEIDNDYFDVERLNPVTGAFLALGRVTGSGNTSEATAYAYVDEGFLAGENVYRLKQVDYDGTVSYSPLAAVEVTGPGGEVPVRVFPNPVAEQLTVYRSGTDRAARAELYGPAGRLVRTAPLTAGTERLIWRRENLPAGVYVLRVRSGEEVHAVKVVLR